MKRVYIHSAFAAMAAASALLAVSQWFELRDRQSTNREVELTLAADAVLASEFATGRDSKVEVILAQSSVLLHHGEFNKAQELLGSLAQNKQRPEVASVAQFNMANAYLREALDTRQNPERKVPLIELSKQRYRDLLKADPQHRDARHNLELALRLAPEKSEFDIDSRGKPIKSVQVIFPGFEDRDLP